MTLESKPFFHDADTDWEEVWPGISRKIIGYHDELMLVKVHFKSGTEAPAHEHPHKQTSYIESGKFLVTIGNRKMEIQAGDGFNVPSGITHSVIALEPGVIIDAFSPHREDFLQ